MIKYLAPVLALGLSLNSHALVDYSETEGSGTPATRPAPARAAAAPIIKRNAPTQAGAKSGASLFGGNFELMALYDHQSLNLDQGSGSFQKLSLSGHFQTQYNLYMDFAYWAATSELRNSDGVDESLENEKGRLKFILGFNWLRFGKAQEMATVDIFGGAYLKGSGGVASTRTDKVVGIETSKRFYNFALALGYEYHLTGTPDAESESAIGNIGILKTSFGWMVSNDISFSLEGGMVNIASAEDTDRVNKIEEESKFSYIKPTLILGLSPSVALEMGGVFRTRRAHNTNSLVSARLWNIPGAYGNSLFAGLKLSI
ncbi:putative exported protein [Halobacteriovorax marinus SJ]|uniref:Exported protein n=1 Tax=Halobacteriovorax marinus (strain ATCC BAA-682 / DSM 15412 / SJ) TaxID=862908 RepID=E1X2J5_HALMS|nr:hypothetical protein [Halobacteriovorax marinus]CBW26762.1 putative exported protein [Halobacteriovorax marinus SJ]